MPQALWFLVWVELERLWIVNQRKWTKCKTIDRFEMTKMLNYYRPGERATPMHNAVDRSGILYLHATRYSHRFSRSLIIRSHCCVYLYSVHCTLYTHLRWTMCGDGDGTSCSYQEHSKYLRLHVGRRWSATSTECKQKKNSDSDCTIRVSAWYDLVASAACSCCSET